MEGVYGRKQHMEKEGGFRKHKRSIGEIWGKDGCRSEEVRKVRYGGGKGFQKRRITREIDSKNII